MTNRNEKEVTVVKFGGSVLENERSMEQAAQLVVDTAEKGFGVVVVVSAMKGVTDQLIALAKKVDPRMEASLSDESLASGEKTSARLMAGVLAGHGIRSVIVDPESPYWPIITDSRHLDANPMMELSREKAQEAIAPLLREGRVPVVCGFLGKTVEGKTT